MKQELSKEIKEQNEVENLRHELLLMNEANSKYAEELENYKIMLEIMNERWISAVNENMHISVQLRKKPK